MTLDADSNEIRMYRLTAETTKMVEFLGGLPAPTRAAYKAGPSGHGLAGALHAGGSGTLWARED